MEQHVSLKSLPKTPRKTSKGARDDSALKKKVDFSKWVRQKDKYERAVNALGALDTDRACKTDIWFETAIALAAVDCQLKIGRTDACDCTGVCRTPQHAITRQRRKCHCTSVKCTVCNRCVGTSTGTLTNKMRQLITAFTSPGPGSEADTARSIITRGEGSTINDSKITAGDVRTAADLLTQCSIFGDGSSTQRPCTCRLRSLGDHWIKWTKAHHTFEKVPLSLEKGNKFDAGTRANMTNVTDTGRKDGEIVSYLMTVKWKIPAKAHKGDTAKIAARRLLSVDEKRQNALFLSLCHKNWIKAQHAVVEKLQGNPSDCDEEREEKEETKSSGNNEKKLGGNRTVHEERILNKIGLKKLHRWIEEDTEVIENLQKTENEERVQEGRSAHEQWLRKKDRLRIRLPPSDEKKGRNVSKPQRWDFSAGKGTVRKTKMDLRCTTVDFMQHSGAKFAYARDEGIDLQQSRKQLLKSGFVHKSNFTGHDDDDNDDEYTMEKNNHKKTNSRKTNSKESFTTWLLQKEARQKALVYLERIDSPNDNEKATESQWEAVGAALKAIDRTLFGHFTSWTGSFKSSSKCSILWDSVSPIACDIHATSSAIRDTLLKLLHRKNVNYKDTFLEMVDVKHTRFVDMDEAGKLLKFDALSSNDFGSLLRNLGIILQKEELERIVDCFDKEGNGKISMKEFLNVIASQDRGDTALVLKDLCMWETVCHECGMQNAFQLVTSQDGCRMRLELPDHIKRRKMKGFGCEPILNMKECKDEAPAACEHSMWEQSDKNKALMKLQLWSSSNREKNNMENMLTGGESPGAPILLRSDDEQMDPTRSMLLRWDPPRVTGNNGPAFYILETSGAVGSQSSVKHTFTELCRDPSNFQDNDGEPRYEYAVNGLQPNCKYNFRIRAVNGFGAGPFVFGSYSTVPVAPPAPIPSQLTSSRVMLRWGDVKHHDKKHTDDIKRLFKTLSKGESVFSRDSFLDEIERRHPRILGYLQRTTGKNSHLEETSLFNLIDLNDDEEFGIDELLALLASSTRPVSSNQPRAAHKYVLKQCINDDAAEYEEIFKGAKDSFRVHNLCPSTTYQFRVQAVNDEGQLSLHSEATVVTTLLPTPKPPLIVGSPYANSIKLKWKSTTKSSAVLKFKGRKKNDFHKVVGEWADGETEVDNLSLNLKTKFDYYDMDHSGYIDQVEFQQLLSDLGLPHPVEKMDEYLTEFDSNGAGRIYFDEFSSWWYRDTLLYTLLHRQLRDGRDNVREILCYTGEENTTTVTGLAPNSTYTFRILQSASNCNSALSPTVSLTTIPMHTTGVGLIDINTSRATLRWYPNAGGACRYIVEMKFIENILNETGSRTRTNMNIPSLEWEQVYHGPYNIASITGLVPHSVYRIRTFAINNEGKRSTSSLETQCCTRENKEVMKPSLASCHFTIECSDDQDIVIGDTILFTERLLNEKEYYGERTIAAYITDIKKNNVSMTVVWSTVESYNDDHHDSSIRMNDQYHLVRDTKIIKSERILFRHETYRRRWKDENARHPSTWEN